MAIQVIKDKAGKPVKFQVQIRVPNEKSESKTFTSFEAAEEYERHAMDAIRALRSAPETRRVYSRQMKPVGVASLASMRVAFLAAEFAKEEPEHGYSRYAKRIGELVGDARVCELDKKWTKQFCESMRASKAHNKETCFAEGTIGQYIAMIRRMCNWRAESLGIDRPRLGLTTDFLKPGWDDGRERRLRGNEEARIREELGFVGAKKLWGKGRAPGQRGKPWACARHYQLIFDFAIETCAREAEMVELPWSEVDLERRVWVLPADRSKTERRRKIYLTPKAVEILKELSRDMEPSSPLVFHRLPTTKGFSNTFHQVIERLDIEDLVFHDLRHEGISRHRLAKNFEPEVLMKMVGHSSVKMTMVYFNPEDEEVLAHMEAAKLRSHVPDLPPAHLMEAVEAMLAQKFESLMSSLASAQTALQSSNAMEREQFAKQLQAFVAIAPQGPLRL